MPGSGRGGGGGKRFTKIVKSSHTNQLATYYFVGFDLLPNIKVVCNHTSGYCSEPIFTSLFSTYTVDPDVRAPTVQYIAERLEKYKRFPSNIIFRYFPANNISATFNIYYFFTVFIIHFYLQI